jgi:CTD nuclear envelope phosphatase 1
VQKDISTVFLLDNSEMSFEKQQANGLLISTWVCDPYDRALSDIISILDALRYVEDVRSVLSLRTRR